MSSEAQRRASKKYLGSKKRIYVTFEPDQVQEIKEIIKHYGYYETLPEFIRDACKYYVKEIKKTNALPNL